MENVRGRPFQKGKDPGGGQKKGHTGNQNGRPKGAANKITARTKQLIADIIEQNYDLIQEDVKTLEPRERLQFFVALIPYVVAKRDQSSANPGTPSVKVIGVTTDEIDDLLIEEVEVLDDED